jgi:membrane dipeptidase
MKASHLTDGYGVFAFGLDEEAEARARRLHDDSVVIDMMFYGPASPAVWTQDLADAYVAAGNQWDPMGGHRFLADRAASGGFPSYRELFDATGGTTGIIQSALGGEEWVRRAGAALERCTQGLPWLRRMRSAKDVEAAHQAGEHALWGMCQINLLRPGELDLVDLAHELGVLHTCDLAYNRMTFIGTGCTERYDAGLSHFGLEFVERCNRVGVLVDTAHSGRQTTLDACAASTAPVLATHTSAKAVYDCDRAKTDEELVAIAATGGVIGVYAVPFFLGEGAGTVELVLDQIAYVAGLVGWEHVGLGTDWPASDPFALLGPDFRAAVEVSLRQNGFRSEHAIDITATLDGFSDYRDLVNITRGLVARGCTDEQVRAVLGGNVLRVFQEVWT